MIGKFWDTVGSKLADRWAALSAPALLFWAGGVLAWLRGHGSDALQRHTNWITAQAGIVQGSVLLAALIVVVASGLIIQRVTLPVLRLVEGYWPRWLDPVRTGLVSRTCVSVERKQGEVANLLTQIESSRAFEQRRSFVELERSLRRIPLTPHRVMPTRVGNILRASESRPFDKYGLDAVKCWPHLWLLLPDAVKQPLAASRAALDASCAALVWGLLFLLWSPWTLWAIPVGLAVSMGAYLIWIPERAATFGDLVEAAFDLYRPALYTALRWPLPTDPADERQTGERVTEYLWRGSNASTPKFVAPKN